MSAADSRPSIPRQSVVWDERRNSSQVIEVLPDALPTALKALAHFRQTDPARVKWILDGHPTLTEAEHVERFGEPYNRPRRRKPDPSQPASPIQGNGGGLERGRSVVERLTSAARAANLERCEL